MLNVPTPFHWCLQLKRALAIIRIGGALQTLWGALAIFHTKSCSCHFEVLASCQFCPLCRSGKTTAKWSRMRTTFDKQYVCLRAYALQNLAKPRTHHSGDNQKNWVSSSKGESMSFWPKSGDKSCWLQYQLHVYVYVYVCIYIYICVCVCYIVICVYIYTYLFIYLLIYLFI